MKPIVYDLFTGLHGWLEAFLLEGYQCVGYDIEDMCASLGVPRPKGIEFHQRDVRSIHGSELKDAAVIVASPPCQKYSYMAMPWQRAKDIAHALRNDQVDLFPEGYEGPYTVEHLNSLFNECFRIQREACEAAGHYIPLIVENVRGAQPWVGHARWNYGSFYLWGDVPALMPIGRKVKVSGLNWKLGSTTYSGKAFNSTAAKQCDSFGWRGSEMRQGTSKGLRRKAASAMIAKIPLPLSQHIARAYKPHGIEIVNG